MTLDEREFANLMVYTYEHLPFVYFKLSRPVASTFKKTDCSKYACQSAIITGEIRRECLIHDSRLINIDDCLMASVFTSADFKRK